MSECNSGGWKMYGRIRLLAGHARWNELNRRYAKLPFELQSIYLDDLLTAMDERLAVLERIANKKASTDVSIPPF